MSHSGEHGPCPAKIGGILACAVGAAIFGGYFFGLLGVVCGVLVGLMVGATVCWCQIDT